MSKTDKTTAQILVKPWIRDALKKLSVDHGETIQVLAERAILRTYRLKTENGAAR